MRVTRAPAQVALQSVTNLLARRFGIVVQQVDSGHNHARRTVAALETVTFPEALLHGMQLAVPGQAFNGRDFRAVRLHSQDSAGLHRAAVEKDGARAAERRFAPDVRAGKLAVVPQEIGEQGAGFDFVFVGDAVDLDGNASFHGTDSVRCSPTGDSATLASGEAEAKTFRRSDSLSLIGGEGRGEGAGRPLLQEP